HRPLASPLPLRRGAGLLDLPRLGGVLERLQRGGGGLRELRRCASESFKCHGLPTYSPLFSQARTCWATRSGCCSTMSSTCSRIGLDGASINIVSPPSSSASGVGVSI